MATLNDFDNLNHRVESATVTFQKGIYHLFVLIKQPEKDVYSQIVRTYQCVFQICLSQLLLDKKYELNQRVRNLSRRLKKFCQKDNEPIQNVEPTRKHLDPACLITHSVFENKKWNGFPTGHPLFSVSQSALDLFNRVVDARHNLIYRPFLLDQMFWEDCTLSELIEKSPRINEVEKVYTDFLGGLWDWRAIESGTRISKYFIQTLFIPYTDRQNIRPSETLLLSYARMLNPDNQQITEDVRKYRNMLLNVDHDPRFAKITFPQGWRFSKV